jgi:hypothetical protein
MEITTKQNLYLYATSFASDHDNFHHKMSHGHVDEYKHHGDNHSGCLASKGNQNICLLSSSIIFIR